MIPRIPDPDALRLLTALVTLLTAAIGLLDHHCPGLW